MVRSSFPYLERAYKRLRHQLRNATIRGTVSETGRTARQSSARVLSSIIYKLAQIHFSTPWRIVARPDIFAQATLSRLGERCSPKRERVGAQGVSLQLQPGEEWARSGEEGSPKRACEKPLRGSVAISPKRGPVA
ncbi:hypothetical protein DEO72_LG10g930 [Vigna unguiculata]|uniref:Uncharacterized protein n=1 Tax=Vigna unguiculata TaxID=3917 RepID=A0A4D6N8T2_VIGUN|nr:hypothetical protein DEO72_LG10g930 [Vigna unguiculata]